MTRSYAAFQQDLNKQIRAAVKGTGWKQSKGVVFRQIDDWFIAGHWRKVSADLQDGLRIELMAKPMALDPMLWETMGLEENNSQPLSFRYWGAFVCGTPVLAAEVIAETDPDRAAPAMIATLDRMVPGLLDTLASNSFSELAKSPVGIHDNWRMSETIVQALRLENEPDLALKYAASERSAYFISGKSHNELFVEQMQGARAPAVSAESDESGESGDRTLGGLFRRLFRR